MFSDIHANLPALEAFFRDVENENPDAIYCLGDLVGYNIWPNEVIREIRSRRIPTIGRIPTIAGNYDFGIGRNSDNCGCAYKTEEEKANGAISIKVTNELIKEPERAYLRALPAHINLEFHLNEDEKLNVLLVHGSPRKITEYIFEDRPEKSLLRILKDSNADVLCFGHTHKPYHRIIEYRDEQVGNFHRHAINIGSIGKPKDGFPTGGYVLLDLSEGSSKKNATSIKVTFKRFEYDVEKAAKAVEKSELPNAYARALREGK